MCYTLAITKEGSQMVSEAQKRAKKRYDMGTRQVVTRWRIKKDALVIAKLDSVPEKTQYIRELILKDVEEHGI